MDKVDADMVLETLNREFQPKSPTKSSKKMNLNSSSKDNQPLTGRRGNVGYGCLVLLHFILSTCFEFDFCYFTCTYEFLTKLTIKNVLTLSGSMNSQRSLSIAIPEFKEDSDEDSDEGSEENESDDVNTSMESRLVPHGVSPMTPGNNF
jgi:hypothetical protein